MTADGKTRFNLVRQRNGIKFIAKKIKVDKDHSFRDEMASLALKVSYIINPDKTWLV